MAVEVKQAKSEAQKIAERLRNSGGDADVHAKHGDGPTRTHTNIHRKGNAGPENPAQPTDGKLDYRSPSGDGWGRR
jgi:hypothetical protein